MGGFSGKTSPHPNYKLLIQSFWAPFLLLHLGGPDTITAYSLEDNELWPRHLLGLVFQVGAAFYVFIRSWGKNGLTFIAIPVFISGIIKYGERTWVLRSSSSKQFRDSLLSPPDPGPDYAEYVEKKIADKDLVALPPEMGLPSADAKTSNDYLSQANYLFERLQYLFADLILGYNDATDCQSMICNKSSLEAFTLVEVELGFLYDVLYTKAAIVYTRYGILLRCISCVSSASALVTFSIIVHKLGHAPVLDVSITYLLLVGALVLEVYALIILLYSDWTKLWFVKHGKNYSLDQVRDVKRWSGRIAQYNLMRFCHKFKEETSAGIKVLKYLGLDEEFEKYQNTTWQNVDVKIKQLIFQQLKKKSMTMIKGNKYDISLCKEFLTSRGDYILKEMKRLELLRWSTVDVEFDQSLLLWHIATELCYHGDNYIGKYQDSDNVGHLKSLSVYRSISRCLSDYMLYLLVMSPNMLPKGIGELRYRDTRAEVIRFFKQKRDKIKSGINIACQELLGVDTDMSLEDIKGDGTKSVLFQGCKLAKQLQSLCEPQKGGWSCEKKWVMIAKVWVEMLSYTAVHCGWKEHAQQLRRGGELITHVCLLMAHLGLSDQYQTQKQYLNRLRKRPKPRLFEELYDHVSGSSSKCVLQCLICIPPTCDCIYS
ncbi:hypothetical protein PTKIN_Ptkin08bG0062300 [Pterospermum kingtungense]